MNTSDSAIVAFAAAHDAWRDWHRANTAMFAIPYEERPAEFNDECRRLTDVIEATEKELRRLGREIAARKDAA